MLLADQTAHFQELVDFNFSFSLVLSFERAEKIDVFGASEIFKKYVVLWTKAEHLPDLIHLSPDIVSVNNGRPAARRVDTSQHTHCRRFARPIMSEKRGNLIFVKLER